MREGTRTGQPRRWLAEIGRYEAGRCRDGTEPRLFERPHRARHVPRVSHEQDARDAAPAEFGRGVRGILEGGAAPLLGEPHRHREFLHRRFFQQCRLRQLVVILIATRHQERQPRLAFQMHAVSQAFQCERRNGIAAVLRRAFISPAGQHHDGLRAAVCDDVPRKFGIGLQQAHHGGGRHRQTQCVQQSNCAAVMGLLQTYPALTRDVIAHSGAQAIVVLAGGRYERAPEYGGDTVSSLALERLRYGVHLQRETRLPLLMSGGNPDDDVLQEAALLKEAAVDEIAVPVWLTEERSRTTLENAAYASAELRRRGITRVLLVTHAWHMPRAMWSFEQAGLGAVAAPTGFVTADLSKPASWLPSTGALAHTRYVMHEILGLLWYRISKNARDI